MQVAQARPVSGRSLVEAEQCDATRAGSNIVAVTMLVIMALGGVLATFDLRYGLVATSALLGVLVVARHYGGLVRRHRALQVVHAFAGAVGRSLDTDEIAQTTVDEFARLFRTDVVRLVIFASDGSIHSSTHARMTGSGVSSPAVSIGDEPSALNDERWASVLSAGCVARWSLDDDQRWRHDPLDGELLAVPVGDDSGVVALLLVQHRLGTFSSFRRGDLPRADRLAGELTTVLRNAFVHASVEHAASHDVLTGNRNRASFEQAIRELPNTGGGSDHECTAVFMIDLNRFKEINDTLGHHVGDRVLVEFSRRLRAILRYGDVGARFGGDEFAVLVRRGTLPEVLAIADQIESAMFVPMRLESLDVVVTASIGIAVIEPGYHDAAEMLRRADVAMYLAKRSGVSVELYRPEIDRRTPERISMLAHIRGALEANSMEVHYQPKVDLVTNTVIGAEALVRWDRPGYGPVDPVDLIRAAEESGVVKHITDYVLDHALAAMRRWYNEGYRLGVSVNLSTHDLLDDQLPHRIDRALGTHGVPPERLTLEITERSLLMDTPRTMATIHRLSRTGVRLSLDDFGTGYSSLGYLRRLPVSELKVDHSFVKNLLLEDQDAVIVRSTIELSHNLGLQVVAEGVENGPALDRLRELGCDIGQGYGISRALPPQMFRTWLRTTGYQVTQKQPSNPLGLGRDFR